MCALVNGESTLLLERTATARKLAHPGHLVRVNPHVLVEGLLGRQGRAANVAMDRLVARVYLHMPLHLAPLREARVLRAVCPPAAEAPADLLELLEMFDFAVLLQLFVVTEAAAADAVAVTRNPAAEELVFLCQDLHLGPAGRALESPTEVELRQASIGLERRGRGEGQQRRRERGAD